MKTTDSKGGKAIKTANVFLDTEVFVSANFNFKSPRLTSIARLAADGRIALFLTDITLREIRANIKEAIQKAADTRVAPILRSSQLPEVQARLKALDTTAIEAEIFTQLDDFIEHARVTVLPFPKDALTRVLDSYFAQVPPFGVGKNRAEFPDALALDTLREWCQTEGRAMSIVTRDGGVKDACSDDGPLYHFEDLPKYLDAVSSDNEARSAFIREMIVKHDSDVLESAKDRFPNLGFSLKDQDGSVEQVELRSIDYDGEIEIISLTAGEAIIEMPATLHFQADVSFYDPGTGYYDSEERVLLFQDTLWSTVTRSTHRRIAAEVFFEDLNPESFQIHRVWFEGNQDIGVTSDYREGW